MIDLFIDPYFLTFFDFHSKDNFIRRVETLADWQENALSYPLKFWLTSKVLDFICARDFPDSGEIARFLSLYGAKYPDPHDVRKMVDFFLKSQVGNVVFQIENLLIDAHECSVKKIETDEDASLATCDSICIAEIALQISGVSQRTVLLVTSKNGMPAQFNHDCEVVEIEPENELQLPIELHSNCVYLEKFLDLVDAIDPTDVWMDLHLAIPERYISALNLYLLKQKKILSSDLSSYNNFSFSEGFATSVSDIDVFSSHKKSINLLLENLSHLVVGEKMNETRPLRTGEGGNNPQLKYNSWKAWRKSIDYEYRLHYWVTNDGFRFSKIVTHNDDSIFYD